MADLRAHAVAEGRAADDVRIFNMATVITDRDEAAARAKLADYRRYVSAESVLVGFSGVSGIDLGKYGLDEPLRYEKTEAVRSIMHIQARDTQKSLTMRHLAERGGSAAAACSSSDRPRRCQTSSRLGSTRPESTASTSPPP